MRIICVYNAICRYGMIDLFLHITSSLPTIAVTTVILGGGDKR